MELPGVPAGVRMAYAVGVWGDKDFWLCSDAPGHEAENAGVVHAAQQPLTGGVALSPSTLSLKVVWLYKVTNASERERCDEANPHLITPATHSSSPFLLFNQPSLKSNEVDIKSVFAFDVKLFPAFSRRPRLSHMNLIAASLSTGSSASSKHQQLPSYDLSSVDLAEVEALSSLWSNCNHFYIPKWYYESLYPRYKATFNDVEILESEAAKAKATAEAADQRKKMEERRVAAKKAKKGEHSNEAKSTPKDKGKSSSYARKGSQKSAKASRRGRKRKGKYNSDDDDEDADTYSDSTESSSDDGSGLSWGEVAEDDLSDFDSDEDRLTEKVRRQRGRLPGDSDVGQAGPLVIDYNDPKRALTASELRASEKIAGRRKRERERAEQAAHEEAELQIQREAERKRCSDEAQRRSEVAKIRAAAACITGHDALPPITDSTSGLTFVIAALPLKVHTDHKHRTAAEKQLDAKTNAEFKDGQKALRDALKLVNCDSDDVSELLMWSSITGGPVTGNPRSFFLHSNAGAAFDDGSVKHTDSVYIGKKGHRLLSFPKHQVKDELPTESPNNSALHTALAWETNSNSTATEAAFRVASAPARPIQLVSCNVSDAQYLEEVIKIANAKLKFLNQPATVLSSTGPHKAERKIASKPIEARYSAAELLQSTLGEGTIFDNGDDEVEIIGAKKARRRTDLQLPSGSNDVKVEVCDVDEVDEKESNAPNKKSRAEQKDKKAADGKKAKNAKSPTSNPEGGITHEELLRDQHDLWMCVMEATGRAPEGGFEAQ